MNFLDKSVGGVYNTYMTQVRTKLCECCGKDFSFKSAKAKFCGTICKQTDLRKRVKAAAPPKTKQCLHCEQEFEYKKKFAKFCCLRCQQMNKRYNNIVDETEMVTCGSCGMKAHDLIGHIAKIHKMSMADYKSLYNTPTRSDKYRQEQSDRMMGDKNPGWQHNGKFSALSTNFIHANTTNKAAVIEKISKSIKENGNNNCTMSYWEKQGFTAEQATEKLSERQTTFSLDICIKKYGLEEGTKRWNDRQEKWMKNCKKSNFSKVSQKLFWEIYAQMLNNTDVYFATLLGGVCDDSGKNHEYLVSLSVCNVKPDFFHLPSKSIIEFDGDYWHGEKRGNQVRDAARDTALINEGFRLLHIKERDYRADPEKTIKQCLEFLNG